MSKLKGEEKKELKLGKYLVTITHENRILFPKSGITKGELIKYYEKIAPIMLPYMKDRLISMQRFPNGIAQEGFYQKDASDYFPEWIKRVPVKKQEGGTVNYVVCNNAATLVYLANQACITNHIWLSRIDKLNNPDRMIFDLDPAGFGRVASGASGRTGAKQDQSSNGFIYVQQAAEIIKDFLEDLGLCAFAMTTGSKGMHIIVPLKRKYSFDEVRQFARSVATVLVKKYPERFTLEMRKQKRGKHIFIDTLRNAFGQTGVAPYSVRPKENAPVATPLFWKEVSDIKLTPTKYTIKNIFKRLDDVGDPWEKIDEKACSLDLAQKKILRF